MLKPFWLSFCGVILVSALRADDLQIGSFKYDRQLVGVIADKQSGTIIGSAFVATDSLHVITCAHVVNQTRSYVYGPNIGNPIELKRQFMLPNYDLAVLALETPVKATPIPLGDLRKVAPGDAVTYCGWDSRNQSLTARSAKVTATGNALSGGKTVQFIEFEGDGIPGYSGGPVFDQSGKIVALMREAWTRQGVHGGNPILVNRAFSTEVIAILGNELVTVSDNSKK